MLFADSGDGAGGTAALVVLCGLVGAAAKWAWDTWAGNRKTRRTESLEDSERNRQRSDELYQRVKADAEEARRNEREAQAGLASLRDQIVEVKLVSVRKAEHIKYLEGLLDDIGQHHRKWQAPGTESMSERETETGE